MESKAKKKSGKVEEANPSDWLSAGLARMTAAAT